MTEHEQLKEICEIIGYDISEELDVWRSNKSDETWMSYYNLDVREIIFTTEFINKFKAYAKIIQPKDLSNYLMQNLDNPTSYLYNLINK